MQRIRYGILALMVTSMQTTTALGATSHLPESSPTFIVHNHEPLPQAFVSELVQDSPIPVVLPTKLSIHQSPARGLVLVAEFQVSSTGYSISLRWRKPNHLNQSIGMVGYAGNISGQVGAPQHAKPAYVGREAIHVDASTSATQLTVRPPVPLFQGQAIVWTNHHWTFTTMGVPDTAHFEQTEFSTTTLGMAKALAGNIESRGIPLVGVKAGLVEQSLESDHGETDAQWTYNGKTWYSILGYNQEPFNILSEVHSSRRFTKTTKLTPNKPSLTLRKVALNAVCMVNAEAGFGLSSIDGRPTLLRTNDGARRWSVATLPPGVGTENWTFDALSPTNAWILNRNQEANRDVIYKTTDAGLHWSRLATVTDRWSFANLDFVSPSRGWLLTNSYPATVQMTWHLYRTSDGGKHWRLVSDSTKASPHGIPGSAYAQYAFTGPNTGWIVGLNAVDGMEKIGVTRNGGAYWRWHSLRAPLHNQNYMATLFAPRFFNSSMGLLPVSFAVGTFGKTVTSIYTTQNAGANWFLAPGTHELTTANPVTVDVANDHRVYVVSSSGVKKGTLYESSDAGKSWTKVSSSSALRQITSIHFASNKLAFAYNTDSNAQSRPGGWSTTFGTNGRDLVGSVLVTRDGGLHFTKAVAIIRASHTSG